MASSQRVLVPTWQRVGTNEERIRRSVFLAWRDHFEDDLWDDYEPAQLRQVVDRHYETQANICASMSKEDIELVLAWILSEGWMKKNSAARKELAGLAPSPIPLLPSLPPTGNGVNLQVELERLRSDPDGQQDVEDATSMLKRKRSSRVRGRGRGRGNDSAPQGGEHFDCGEENKQPGLTAREPEKNERRRLRLAKWKTEKELGAVSTNNMAVKEKPGEIMSCVPAKRSSADSKSQ